MAKGRISDFYLQYEELTEKFEKQEKLLKDTNNLVKTLNIIIENLNETNQRLQNLIEEKDKEILRLKSKNNRDSSNSNKPSGTNGYKKVIINRREKSNKPKGAQMNHKPHSLKNKLNQFIDSLDVKKRLLKLIKMIKIKTKDS